jgi:hypothetical protein
MLASTAPPSYASNPPSKQTKQRAREICPLFGCVFEFQNPGFFRCDALSNVHRTWMWNTLYFTLPLKQARLTPWKTSLVNSAQFCQLVL